MAYTYKNKVTGAVITVPSLCGGDWELMTSEDSAEKAEKEKAPKKSTTKSPKKK